MLKFLTTLLKMLSNNGIVFFSKIQIGKLIQIGQLIPHTHLKTATKQEGCFYLCALFVVRGFYKTTLTVVSEFLVILGFLI